MGQSGYRWTQQRSKACGQKYGACRQRSDSDRCPAKLRQDAGQGYSYRIQALFDKSGQLLGLNKGEIAIGGDADLIILDEQMELLFTIVSGKVVHSTTT